MPRGRARKMRRKKSPCLVTALTLVSPTTERRLTTPECPAGELHPGASKNPSATVVVTSDEFKLFWAWYLCRRRSLPPHHSRVRVPALLLVGVLAPSRAAQWGLIYAPRSSDRYLPALFTNSVFSHRGLLVPQLSPSEGASGLVPVGRLALPRPAKSGYWMR